MYLGNLVMARPHLTLGKGSGDTCMYPCHANHNGKDGRLITVCQCSFPDLAFMKDKGLAHFAGNLGLPDLAGEELVRSQWWIQDLHKGSHK